MSGHYMLISSDYERVGSVYYYDRSSGYWYGHMSSKSYWVRNVKAPMLLQHELRRKALSQGYCPEIFSKPQKSVLHNKDVVGKKKKVAKKVTKKVSSETFIPLF